MFCPAWRAVTSITESERPDRPPARRRLPRWAGGAALVVAALVVATAIPMAAGAPTGLVVSASSNRSNPVALGGATLTGNTYIFVTGYSQARRVRFTLDNGSPVTRSSPFDYAGTRSSGRANALDTTGLADGPHAMTAVVLRSNGTQLASLAASFTVTNNAIPAPPPTPPPAAAGQILVPAYFYPGADWTRMCATLPVGAIAIMNPNSGPGTGVDPAYTAAVNDCRSKGVGVIGYVYTSYGARSASSVRADVDAYFSRYPVSGIFFDEGSTDPATQSYYASLFQYVHAKSTGPLVVVTNPGTAAATSWQLDGATADIVNIFEGSPSQFAAWSPPAWVAVQSAARLASIVYATATQTDMQAVCARAKTLNLGWSYVTTDVLPNPFDILPADPYWSAELTACR